MKTARLSALVGSLLLAAGAIAGPVVTAAGAPVAPKDDKVVSLTCGGGFTTPDGMIVCDMAVAGYVRCEINEVRSWKPPPKPPTCEYEWAQGRELTAPSEPFGRA